MRALRLPTLVAAISLVAALGLSLAPRVPAVADSPSATVIPPTTTPVIVLETPKSSPTAVITVAPEESTPIATVDVPPVPADVAPTEPVVIAATPTRAQITNPTPFPTSPGPSPVGTPASSGIYAPTPSPADLQAGARLRWGDHVPSQVRRWAFLIVPIAHKYGLDPNLIAAVMTMESNGDPLALSGADARGLMQVLHGPWDPRENIETGARMLANLFARFHDLRLVLAAYNAGPGAVEAYRGVPPYRETRDYVIIVSYLYDLFGHRHLTVHRRHVYQSTLHDLTHFASQRRKVATLARIAHVRRDPLLNCVIEQLCGPKHVVKPLITGDPFWPLAGRPDPLQRVDPFSAG